MRPIEKIVIHHSASSRGTTVEQIRDWHVNERGFGSLGYHFVIGWNGSIRQGRSIDKIGAHAQGHNLKSIGICMTGDNTKEESRWTDEQISCLRALVQTLCIFFPQAEVLGHRDLKGAKTLCPGLNVRALLARGE